MLSDPNEKDSSRNPGKTIANRGPSRNLHFPIAGIGAFSGGLEALPGFSEICRPSMILVALEEITDMNL